MRTLAACRARLVARTCRSRSLAAKPVKPSDRSMVKGGQRASKSFKKSGGGGGVAAGTSGVLAVAKTDLAVRLTAV